MAKILFISALYPESKNQSRSEKTFALHNFVKYWKDEVIVIKPVKIAPLAFRNYFRHKRVELDGVPVYMVPYVRTFWRKPFVSRLFTVAAIKLLRELAFSPDIVISHYKMSHVFGKRIAKRLGVKRICGVHSTDIRLIGADDALGKAIARALLSADKVTCRSEHLRRKLAGMLPRLGGKPLGVSNSGISPAVILDPETLAEKGRRKGLPRLVTVATLKKRKNVQQVLEAYARLADQFESYTVVGGGECLDELKYRAETLGVSDGVKFTGQVKPDEVIAELRDKDVFILVSDNETFGLVYLEAMAQGCLVVGLRDEGIDGILCDGINGFLCPDPSVDSVEAKLRQILAMDDASRSVILRNSVETVAGFTEERMAIEYGNMVSAVLKSE